jgi:undecaprenyl diphosphate synthase
MTANAIIPTHVAMIMDGNGRWAKQREKERVFGHKEGIESVRACTEYAVEKGVKYLSLFAFSEENWGRPKEEISILMGYMMRSIINETPSFHKNGIRFIVIGDTDRLDLELRQEIKKCMEQTANNAKLNLIIYLSYSGKWDIIQAINKYTKQHPNKEITSEEFEKYLSTAGIPNPDLLIRTGGEQRISNFMLWQTAYTEYYFTNTLWPDFRKIDFQKALDAFSHRERRFGKV